MQSLRLSDFTDNTAGLVVFSFFVVVILIQVIYYLYFYARLAFYKPVFDKEKTEPVSVIICARNEKENLEQNLPLILAQDHPDFEVIVVNDRSYDGSFDLLEQMAEKNPKLKIVNLDEDVIKTDSKKFALTMGIKKAAHDILLLTDADCKPATSKWIKCMQQRFTDDIDIVLGFGGYEKKNFSFLNLIIRFDTFFTALQYFSYSLTGNTYMGVGRNLAYRKHLFFDNKGFGSHNHIRSGDDDLFINQVAHKSKVNIAVVAESHTVSKPKDTWGDWFYQKRRHLTTGPLYKAKYKFLLGLSMFTKLMVYPLLAVLLVMNYNPSVVLALFAILFIIQLIIFRRVMVTLKHQDLFLISPLIDLVLPYITFLLSATNLFSKPKSWK